MQVLPMQGLSSLIDARIFHLKHLMMEASLLLKDANIVHL